jgi:cobalt-zinc-cadmium efflux system outer membrane protein
MALIRWSFWTVSLVALAGCSLLESKVDREIRDLSDLVSRVDIRPALDLAPAAASEVKSSPAATAPPPPAEKAPEGPPGQDAPLQPIALLQQDKKKEEKKEEEKKPHPLDVPPGLPGADAPPITGFPEDPEEKKRYVQRMFPPLPPAPQLAPAAPGPEGRPMTLADLQRLAAIYSPAIKSAEAAVQAAAGAAKQAGVYPNPIFFFEQDTVGTGASGYEGFGVHQTVKTGNKLKLQQAAAMMDLLNARLALKRAYTDLSYQVRTNYFAVLVALAGIKANAALYQFTNEIFLRHVERVAVRGTAPGVVYEPLQLRPLALQARLNLIQAQNQYLASWRQLAAALGLPDMPPTELAGQVDMPVPVFEYNQVLARLSRHTDVLTAYNNIQKAKFNLALARIIPVPDVDLNILAQKDSTAPPNLIVHSLQVSVPVPFFDQNLGGIRLAEGLLAQAYAGPDQARNALITTLADAFNRYQTARETVAVSMQQVRDQLVAYRALRGRWGTDPTAVGFGDLVTAQQTLAGFIAGYITALGLQWVAVADVANLLQTDDLFGVGPTQAMEPVPDLRQLTPPPGCDPRRQGR